VAEAKKSGAGDTYARERMEELLGFVVLMSALFEEFRNLSPSAMKRDVETARRDPQNPARVTGAGSTWSPAEKGCGSTWSPAEKGAGSAFTLNASSEAWEPVRTRRGGHPAFLRHRDFS